LNSWFVWISVSLLTSANPTELKTAHESALLADEAACQPFFRRSSRYQIEQALVEPPWRRIGA
jgi:hypothetical protein